MHGSSHHGFTPQLLTSPPPSMPLGPVLSADKTERD
jgi:hypothetical protein